MTGRAISGDDARVTDREEALRLVSREHGHIGTAFLVEEKLAITARHCVEDSENGGLFGAADIAVEVSTNRQQNSRVEELVEVTGQDLVLLRLRDELPSVRVLALRTFPGGARNALVSRKIEWKAPAFPSADPTGQLLTGIITEHRGKRGIQLSFPNASSAEATKFASGAPVMLVDTGVVVGVLLEGPRQQPHVLYAIPFDDLEQERHFHHLVEQLEDKSIEYAQSVPTNFDTQHLEFDRVSEWDDVLGRTVDANHRILVVCGPREEGIPYFERRLAIRLMHDAQLLACPMLFDPIPSDEGDALSRLCTAIGAKGAFTRDAFWNKIEDLDSHVVIVHQTVNIDRPNLTSLLKYYGWVRALLDTKPRGKVCFVQPVEWNIPAAVNLFEELTTSLALTLTQRMTFARPDDSKLRGALMRLRIEKELVDEWAQYQMVDLFQKLENHFKGNRK